MAVQIKLRKTLGYKYICIDVFWLCAKFCVFIPKNHVFLFISWTIVWPEFNLKLWFKIMWDFDVILCYGGKKYDLFPMKEDMVESVW